MGSPFQEPKRDATPAENVNVIPNADRPAVEEPLLYATKQVSVLAILSLFNLVA